MSPASHRYLLWLTLGAGLLLALLANLLWPLLLVEKLGYQCSPPTVLDPQQVCAGGLSYLFPLLSLVAATAIVGAAALVTFRFTLSLTNGSRWFSATGILPSFVLIYALSLSNSFGEAETAIPVTVSAVSSSACLLAAALPRVVSKALLGCAAIASAIGVVIEPGASATFLLTGSIALVGILTPAIPERVDLP